MCNGICVALIPSRSLADSRALDEPCSENLPGRTCKVVAVVTAGLPCPPNHDLIDMFSHDQRTGH
ncbi:hypothetical protein SynBMKMC1_01162 [Synechococcus sp. BMK-MC-1]|nr:hypothetical protein SynBMKMC1_01162 [Synechococcus sp. BMK-MC-1]